jgi:hypothetical protein
MESKPASEAEGVDDKQADLGFVNWPANLMLRKAVVMSFQAIRASESGGARKFQDQ